MSRLKNHGLIIDTPNHGTLKFGIVDLIRKRQSVLWNVFPNISEEQRQSIKRFDKRAYYQCANKCNNTVFDLNKALYKLGNSLLIAENQDTYCYDGAPMETAGIYFEAMNDIGYHLDAFISYLRILVDCISFALPFFYETTIKIKNTGFREQMKWHLKTQPDFDPEYSTILREQTKWFELLAGREINGISHKGIRDLNFHNFATYQIGQTVLPDGRHQILVSQVAINGVVHNDVLSTLEDLIEDFFYYLDRVYDLFTKRFSIEIPTYDWFAPSNSVLVNLEMPDIQSKYRLYPLLNQ
jgi:hypothetical protein